MKVNLPQQVIFKGMLRKINKYMSSREILLLFLLFSKPNIDRSQQGQKTEGPKTKAARVPGNLEPKLFQVPRKPFGLVRKIERKSAK
jgi:hypothetical protein